MATCYSDRLDDTDEPPPLVETYWTLEEAAHLLSPPPRNEHRVNCIHIDDMSTCAWHSDDVYGMTPYTTASEILKRVRHGNFRCIEKEGKVGHRIRAFPNPFQGIYKPPLVSDLDEEIFIGSDKPSFSEYVNNFLYGEVVAKST